MRYAMRKVWVDTNVILRFLLQDHETMSPAAAALFMEGEKGLVTLCISSIVIAESCYVLTGSRYRFAQEKVSQTLADLLLMDGVEAAERDLLLDALDVMARRSIDFADAFLVALAKTSEDRCIASFDADLLSFGLTSYFS